MISFIRFIYFFLSTKKHILDRNKTKRFQYFLIHSLVSFFHDFFSSRATIYNRWTIEAILSTSF